MLVLTLNPLRSIATKWSITLKNNLSERADKLFLYVWPFSGVAAWRVKIELFVELDWCYWFFVLFLLLLIDLLSLFIVLMAHNFNSVFIIEKSDWHLFQIDSEIWIETCCRETIALIIFTNFMLVRNLWLRVHRPMSMLKLASSYLPFSMQVSRTFCQSLIELTFFAMKYFCH